MASRPDPRHIIRDHGAASVAIYVTVIANQRDGVDTTYADLAELLGVTVRHIKRLCAVLIEHGYIYVVEGGGRGNEAILRTQFAPINHDISDVMVSRNHDIGCANHDIGCANHDIDHDNDDMDVMVSEQTATKTMTTVTPMSSFDPETMTQTMTLPPISIDTTTTNYSSSSKGVTGGNQQQQVESKERAPYQPTGKPHPIPLDFADLLSDEDYRLAASKGFDQADAYLIARKMVEKYRGTKTTSPNWRLYYYNWLRIERKDDGAKPGYRTQADINAVRYEPGAKLPNFVG